MKTFSRLSALFALLLCLLVSTEQLHGQSFTVERYTILDSATFQYDQGYLLKNGGFQTIVSSVYDVNGPLGVPLTTLEPISGRPVMMASAFDAYKAVGALPNWVRSRDVFYIGFIGNVIVSVKGGLDPNPIPQIVDQPESQRILVGQTAFFFVDATPAGYASYQWLFKNKPLPGQTGSILFVNNVGPAQAGIYTVAVDTGGKSVTSQKALLQIVTPVSIKTQPKSQTVTAGKNATFRVYVSGTGPLAYQWYCAGFPVTNATKSFLTISKVQTTNAGTYAVFVNNGLSFVISSNAVLSVVP
jgi:hypothetical protein